MPRISFRLAVALLTFITGLTGVWLINLGSQLADAVLDRLMPPPTIESLETNFVPPLGAVVPEWNAEAYAVYDVILNNTIAAEPGPLLIIKSETNDYFDWSGDAATWQRYDNHAPAFFDDFVHTDLARADTDTLDNYIAVNRQPHVLLDLFRLRTPHMLITGADMNALMGGRGLWTGQSKNYPPPPSLYGFSAVGFNRERTQALVHFWNSGGLMCSTGWYVLLEKRDGNWQITKRMGLWVS